MNAQGDADRQVNIGKLRKFERKHFHVSNDISIQILSQIPIRRNQTQGNQDHIKLSLMIFDLLKSPRIYPWEYRQPSIFITVLTVFVNAVITLIAGLI
jgi:hypothetical protein